MKLYNTMSRQVEEVVPIHPGEIGIYACGPTVYDYTHIGHLRKYVMDDVLVRTLRHSGFDVTHVMNITDVGHLTSDDDDGEDKLEKGAKKYKMTVWDLAQKFEKFFWDSLGQMNVQRPDVVEKVTDCIQEQINLVKDLEEKGYTYEIPGDGIYFDTSKLDDYGKLARLDIENLKAGARVEVEGKRNITDFALWKYEREGENRQMSWPSPWAERGFPGWHIECSVIGMKNLGQQFDIHTGGIDHIPVHHTNEIAQSEAATGKVPFVKYWVHHNFLRVDGEKMSKSLGNFYTIEDVVEKGYEPGALRLLFLGTHYRSEMNFTWEALEAAQKGWERLLKQSSKFKAPASPAGGQSLKKSGSRDLYSDFKSSIEDDLNTPKAVAIMWELISDSSIPDGEKYDLLLTFDEHLGLGIEEATTAYSLRTTNLEDIPDEIQQLVEKRKKAREDKDWQLADELRDALAELGYEVLDTAEGQEVTKLLSH